MQQSPCRNCITHKHINTSSVFQPGKVHCCVIRLVRIHRTEKFITVTKGRISPTLWTQHCSTGCCVPVHHVRRIYEHTQLWELIYSFSESLFPYGIERSRSATFISVSERDINCSQCQQLPENSTMTETSWKTLWGECKRWNEQTERKWKGRFFFSSEKTCHHWTVVAVTVLVKDKTDNFNWHFSNQQGAERKYFWWSISLLCPIIQKSCGRLWSTQNSSHHT